jgi:hypothetical protein
VIYLKEALALVVDVGVGMSQGAPGFDSPLQIASDILQMIVQRKVKRIISIQLSVLSSDDYRCFKKAKMN